MPNPYKMTYHVEPTRGLLNDPNGLVQFNGKYYFFHQWNRFDLDHSYKEWGLFTSPDLVNWESVGSAILPDREEDRHGIYSGSAVTHDGRLYLFYTGNNKDNGVRTSRQCIAVSEDGRRFLKLPEYIDTPNGFTQHHRDPKVFRGSDRWWMLVGAQKDSLSGAIALYESDDLVHWKYRSVLYDDDLDQVSECPDLYSLGDTDILVICPQTRRVSKDGKSEEVESYAGYVPGKFDEEDSTFRESGPRQSFDYGFDFYSPQTLLDDQGRRIMTAWMSRMDDEQEAACPTREHGYIHCLTLPRVLTWEDGALRQRPVPEVRSLRKGVTEHGGGEGGFDVKDGHFELTLERKDSNAPLHLSILNGTIRIDYKPEEQLFVVTRRNWARAGTETRELKLAELNDLDIFCDASALEIFVNDGQAVFSMRFFSDPENRRIDYSGLVSGEHLEYYKLRRERV